jgi:hypothetical protein
MTDTGSDNNNSIDTFVHCEHCYSELKNAKTEEDFSLIGAVAGESMMTYARFEVGWTNQGFQVWCTRHNHNVMHIDFDDIINVKKLREMQRKEKK